jgi:regulator of replication initiation timing
MALTNAERQAAFKAKRAETMDALAQQNAALLAEVAELRAEVDRLREKGHRLELAALRAQIKTQEPVKVAAAKKAAPKKAR